jgi:hypothetical protein
MVEEKTISDKVEAPTGFTSDLKKFLTETLQKKSPEEKVVDTRPKQEKRKDLLTLLLIVLTGVAIVWLGFDICWMITGLVLAGISRLQG